jgi:hypothetical protein
VRVSPWPGGVSAVADYMQELVVIVEIKLE